MEKKIQIKWNGEPAEVTVGIITWKEKTDAIRKSIRDVQRGRQLKREVDSIMQKELLMLASIKKAPFEINIEHLAMLSGVDGERIYNAYAELNELTEEDDAGEASSESGSSKENSRS